MAVSLTRRLLGYAEESGLDLTGVASAEPFTRDGESIDPLELLAGARSIVVAGFYMKGEATRPPATGDGPIGRFSSAYNVRSFTVMEAHYFGLIRRFLNREGFSAVLNSDYRLPDKMAALRAGLGRYGKNSLIQTERFGSCVMFVTVVTDAPLEPSLPLPEQDPCGACDLCLGACPTGAFRAPYRINRRLCITNWLWGVPVPARLRSKQENRLFGCGDCVQICPKNRELEPRRSFPVALEDAEEFPALLPLASAGPETYRRTFAAFPLRAGVDALRGNVVIALGNAGDARAVEPLGTVLRQENPRIRAYSAWALGRIGGAEAVRTLKGAFCRETDASVKGEIEQALA